MRYFTNILKIKSSYLFNIIALVILLGAMYMYNAFVLAKQNIKEINHKSNITHVSQLSQNIVNLIKINLNDGQPKLKLYDALDDSQILRKHIEDELTSFLTNQYKYIYVVDKIDSKSRNFRILLDATEDYQNKSDFGDYYRPLNFNQWEKVYKNKKPLYFSQDDIQQLWITYLCPIIIDNQVEAILVVDFSLEEQVKILSSLSQLDNLFEIALIMLSIVFVFIIYFSYIDLKRENLKQLAYKKLHQKNLEVKQHSQEVIYLNQTLEKRVKEEVSKNTKKEQILIQQSRLAQMGEMISMIAHQWRQPLTAISARTSNLSFKLMMNEKFDKELFQTELDHINNYSQHLSKTIDDFRNFFKEKKEKESTSLAEIVDSTLDIVQTSVENKNIKIIKNNICEKEFETYPSELKQVLLNIIKNAEDALLEVGVDNSTIIIESVCNRKELIIKDNAGGIDETIIDKIFDPYFSTKEAKDGTGLGLYMSKIIIEDHCGGKLEASNEDDGAVFKISL